MEDWTTYMVMLMLLIPVYSAITCGVMTGLSYHDCLSREERSLKRLLMVYLLMSGFGWFTTFAYRFYPELFVWLNTACMFVFMVTSIFFYRIIRFLTRLGQAEDFPLWHYLVPGLLAVVMLVWSCFVPFDIRLEIVQGQARVIPEGYELYTRFFTLKLVLRVIFGISYYILALLLLVSYYKRAIGKYTLVRKPADWVIFLVGVSVASLISSMLPALVSRSGLYHSFLTAIVTCCIATQHVLLTYHIIRREYRLYIVYTSPDNAEKEEPVKRRRKHSGKLDQERVEKYFKKHKPYLDPNYKITNLVEDLDVNRTVISAFINQTYGMNFNRFLNRWRLREMEWLRSLPANQGKSVSSLINQTGFGDYRTYSRAIAAEREATGEKQDTKRDAKEEGGTQ